MGGGRAAWLKQAAEAAAPKMPTEKLKRWGEELKKGVWGYFENGKWKQLGISARKRAMLRREVLLAGGEWPYDPPRKEMKSRMKGHKVDRIAAEKRQRTEELMQKMPQMIEEYRQRMRERRAAAKK